MGFRNLPTDTLLSTPTTRLPTPLTTGFQALTLSITGLVTDLGGWHTPRLRLRYIRPLLRFAMPFLRTLAVFLVLSSALLADELRTLGGKVIVGKVTQVTDKDITIKTDKDEIKTPLDQV